jgi:glycosyltransferase 2 family protein
MPDQPAGAQAASRVDPSVDSLALAPDGEPDRTGPEPSAGPRAGATAAQAGATEPPPRAGGALALALRLAGSRPVRWLFLAATIGLGGYAIADGWPHVQAGLSRIGPVEIVGGLLCVLAGLLATMQVYRVLLAALGSRLPVRVAAQILFVGQLGKYLPGSVWPVLAQMQLGTAHKVPRTRSASASVLAMLMSLVSGILVGLVIVPFAGRTTPYWWVFLLAPVIVVCMHPRLLNRILNRLLRFARRPPLDRPLTGQDVAVALAWGVVVWVFFGLQIWLLGNRLGLSSGSDLLLAIGSFAFAWCAGFLIVFAPAGAGIREVVLVALLAGTMKAGDATAIALVSRVLMTAGDLISAGTAALFARRSRLGGAHRSVSGSARAGQPPGPGPG